ncbi:MAG: hypothetical protein QOH13_2026 [Thermoleophilaceae bacterium]|jgi:hypothetical protein|nr:hypothetical protein [Thermoleophilaceae bacterium]
MTATAFAPDTERDRSQVRAVLEAAGARGASHEDFVEAGLARGYIAALRHLVDVECREIGVDFTTGAARWSLRPELERRAA